MHKPRLQERTRGSRLTARPWVRYLSVPSSPWDREEETEPKEDPYTGLRRSKLGTVLGPLPKGSYWTRVEGREEGPNFDQSDPGS